MTWPADRPWEDPDGVPYDWSASTSCCGHLYVRDGLGKHPTDEQVAAWYDEHVDVVHGGDPALQRANR